MGRIKGLTPRNATKRTVNFEEICPENLVIKAPPKDEALIRVIQAVKDQLQTESIMCNTKIRGREAVTADPGSDLLKICVIERHRYTGRIGKGFVKGFGFKEGAIASSVAHDSHNVIAVGVDERDICIAVNGLRKMAGGLIITCKDHILGELPLPVAGLMSLWRAEDIARKMRELHDIAASLGCKIENPFMTLSFLALPVIPKLRITDRGLIDVKEGKVVDLFIN